MSEQLPEAVERVLQQFEAMAGAETWAVDEYGNLRVDEEATWARCPLVWMAGFPEWGGLWTTDRAREALGLTSVEAEAIFGAADSDEPTIVRARLLAAVGLA